MHIEGDPVLFSGLCPFPKHEINANSLNSDFPPLLIIVNSSGGGPQSLDVQAHQASDGGSSAHFDQWEASQASPVFPFFGIFFHFIFLEK